MGERKEVTAEFVKECMSRCQYYGDYVEEILRECAPVSAKQIITLKMFLHEKLQIVLRKEFFTDKDLRLMACDVADYMLPFFEEKHPTDPRPRKTIHTSRCFACGMATKKQLKKALNEAFEAYTDARTAAEKEDKKAAFWSVGYALQGRSRRNLVIRSAFAAWRVAASDAAYAAFETASRIIQGELFSDSYFEAYHKKAKKEVMKIVKRYIKAGGE